MAVAHEESRGGRIDFGREPDRYRHFAVEIDSGVATVTLAVDPEGGLSDGYRLKLNSYDLAVDIELYDIVQRLRFEHPEVGSVVVTGGLDKVFSAGANIQMLACASHHDKVNFCKFTNETRLAIEDASAVSGQHWIAALNASAAGGGYELALACDEIILVDDRSSAISLPEVPLLGVLPGTGGLTRLVDKRHVRKDLADLLATRAEGVRGEQAVAWGLADSTVPRSGFTDHVRRRAAQAAQSRTRPAGPGVAFHRLERDLSGDGIEYPNLSVRIDRATSAARIEARGPDGRQPATPAELVSAGDSAWVLALCRELEDAVLHLRFNEEEIGSWVLCSAGDADAVLYVEEMLDAYDAHWLVREIRAYWKRMLKRLDTSSRTLFALVEPGSCFAGTLAELVLCADRSFMLEGSFEGSTEPPPVLTLTAANDGPYPMGNGLSRLGARYFGHEDGLELVRQRFGKALGAPECSQLGLVTSAPDELDWHDEIRLALEERAAFSPDAASGLEANLRFVGPETMETKIFGRLSAWQNWIFCRPNASGGEGALRRYGSGSRPSYDRRRV